MTKAEMKRAAFAVSAIFNKRVGLSQIQFEESSHRYSVPVSEIDASNVRFNWTLEEDLGHEDKDWYYMDCGLLEASMLLSEASRNDFDYQEPECS